MPIASAVGVHQGDGSLTGTTLSHYRILERIGEGATSVVYKAEDLSLGRVVALKLLPSPASPDLGKIARFQHEARTASTLTHPNICTIFEIGEHEGRHFISMEFLEGQPLSAMIAGRPLEIYRLIELAIQIADGLEAAHAERIIHRDLKPANIYVTYRDHVKLLDFGLSVLLPYGTGSRTPTSATWLAEPGGTVPYMSPEQTVGEQLDTRSDLFSLGVVLYEMATGGRPFTGGTTAALMDAIRQEAPFPARDLNTTVPDELNRIIEKALEKNRKLRYQTASDVCADLRRLKRDLDTATVAVPASASAAVPATEAGIPRRAPHGARWSTAHLVGAAAIAGALAAFGAPGGPTPDGDSPEPPASKAAPAVAAPIRASAAPEPEPVSPPAPATAPPSPPRVVPPAALPAGPVAAVDPFDVIEARRARVWADQQIDIAQSKIDLQLYDQALETLADLIRNHGTTAAAPKAYLMKAAVLGRQGKGEDALATYLEMAARYPDHPRAAEALVSMAEGILQSRRRDRQSEARRLYTDVATKFPASPWAPRALLARGELEHQQGSHQWDSALAGSVPQALVTYRHLANTYDRSPEREHALWRLAELYADIRRFDLSVEALRELAEGYPSTRYDAWFTAAEIYEKRLEMEATARAAYARVPAGSPKYAEAQRRAVRR